MLPRMWTRDVVQDIPPEGVIDLADGFLGPELLPLDLMTDAYARAMQEYGAAALTYGANLGALPLRTILASRAQADGPGRCQAENVMVTAGTSQALHLLATTLGAPGDVVLCEQASYHLALRLFADFGLKPVPIPSDSEGPDPQAMTGLVSAQRAAGKRISFVYLIPTFHNPTGRTIGEERRGELLVTAREQDLVIVEDDAYAELCLDAVPLPAPLAAMACYEGVIRLCTFSKTLGPGLRVGWLLGDKRLIARLEEGGLLASGGCLNHMTSLAVTLLLQGEEYDRRLTWLRDRLRERRDALVSGLQEGANHGQLHIPHGGFFLWLRNMDGDTAQQTGVRVADGSRFGAATDRCVRLSWSFNSPEDLEEAGRRLAAAG